MKTIAAILATLFGSSVLAAPYIRSIPTIVSDEPTTLITANAKPTVTMADYYDTSHYTLQKYKHNQSLLSAERDEAERPLIFELPPKRKLIFSRLSSPITKRQEADRPFAFLQPGTVYVHKDYKDEISDWEDKFTDYEDETWLEKRDCTAFTAKDRAWIASHPELSSVLNDCATDDLYIPLSPSKPHVGACNEGSIGCKRDSSQQRDEYRGHGSKPWWYDPSDPFREVDGGAGSEDGEV